MSVFRAILKFRKPLFLFLRGSSPSAVAEGRMLWCEVSEDFFPPLTKQDGLTPSKSSESSHQEMQNAPKGANIGKTLRFGADFSLIEHPSACTGAGVLSKNVPEVRTKRR